MSGLLFGSSSAAMATLSCTDHQTPKHLASAGKHSSHDYYFGKLVTCDIVDVHTPCRMQQPDAASGTFIHAKVTSVVAVARVIA